MTECKPKRREHGGSPTQHQVHVLRQNRSNLEKMGWLEKTEGFVLHHNQAEQGIQAITLAVHIIRTATCPYGDTWEENAEENNFNSKLVATLEAIGSALRPLLEGRNPETLMLPSYTKRNKRKHEPVIVSTDHQILSALDCWHQHIPDGKLPFKRFAQLLRLWKLENRGERTLRNIWRDRPKGFSYDAPKHVTGFYFTLIKSIHSSDSLRRNVTKLGIEEALRRSIDNVLVKQESK